LHGAVTGSRVRPADTAPAAMGLDLVFVVLRFSRRAVDPVVESLVAWPLSLINPHIDPPLPSPRRAPAGIFFLFLSLCEHRHRAELSLEKRLFDIAEILAVGMQRHRVVADDLDSIDVVRIQNAAVARVTSEHGVGSSHQ
jgi:hypothetical protein